MINEILRHYLEIKSFNDLKSIKKTSDNYFLDLVNPKDFQINKFFYKQIGKKYNWFDRLVWNDKNWINYISNENVFTYVLKYNNELIGFSELIIDKKKQEIEIAYLGIFEEYFGKKLGGLLLTEVIKKCFTFNIERVWVHTCSLDHKNALKNYLSRGMKIFKTEAVKIKTA
tara:strand:- start:1004 stop:1516 length:513 start_codon:yes stop_codon:yes gene_type:complete